MSQSTIDHQNAADESIHGPVIQSRSNILRVATLNLAHGRKDGLNQLLLGKKTIHNNLLIIAETLIDIEADVVGLQEADGSSRWSGGFDHVALLANQARYPWHHRAGHANGWLFDYGTAILSRWPLIDKISHTFPPSPPTLSKGFTLVQVAWQPDPGRNTIVYVDVVSAHLDFSRQKVREEQIDEMVTVLANRDKPMIVLGDFNSDWLAEQSVVKDLARQLRLKVYQPESTELGTYVKNGRRLDWILISTELEFNR
ncbi:endonuclease/exonuclease/phosphatase family protein, partial [Pseudomonadota bacterium]